MVSNAFVLYSYKYMSENLEIIFNSVLNKAYKLRKANPTKFDGQGFWQPIKKMLEPLDEYSAKKWKKIPKKLTRSIMLLPEYTINGYEEKIIIQQVRIPLTEKPTIRKIIQIALNIGQHKGSKGKPCNISRIGLNNIKQFIYQKDIIELSKHISNDIVRKIRDYLDGL
jgi:hypothetical protein